MPIIEPGTPITVTTDASFPAGGGVTVNPYNIFDSSNVITKFNFNGTFADNNIKQTFKVTYTLKGATDKTNKDFSFRYIKSLKNAAPFPSIPFSPCKVLNLGIGSVTIPRCVIQNIPLNFNNVTYSTPTEPNDFCWGSIQQYEYQLPIGWSIGGTVSNGSNWIVDDSNVVITSNLGNGDLGKIRVRPSNANCGTGLQNGQIIAEILISRPAPTLSITGADAICTNGVLTSYNVNGLPAGATVLWEASLPNQVQISGCSTCTTVNLNKIGLANTSTILKATVTDCVTTYPPVTKTVALGSPGGIGIVSYSNMTPCQTDAYFSVLSAIQPNLFDFSGIITVGSTGVANSLTWSLPSGYNNNGWSWSASSGSVTVSTKQSNTNLTLRATATNGCGSAFKNYNFRSGACNIVSRLALPGFSIQPNPTKGIFIVTAANSKSFVRQVIIKSKMGIIVKKINYNTFKVMQNINIQDLAPDCYFIQIFDGNKWETKKIIKE